MNQGKCPWSVLEGFPLVVPDRLGPGRPLRKWGGREIRDRELFDFKLDQQLKDADPFKKPACGISLEDSGVGVAEPQQPLNGMVSPPPRGPTRCRLARVLGPRAGQSCREIS